MSILLSLAVAVLLAISSLLQHRATNAVPPVAAHGFALFRHLLRSRSWLVAKVIDVVALGLEVVALAKGSLVVFQTIITSGVVIAIVAESRRAKRRLHKRELAGAIAIILGAAMVSLAQPQGPDLQVSLRGWLIACTVAAALIVTGVRLTRHDVRYAAPMLGAATAWNIGGFTFVIAASALGYVAAAVLGNVIIHRAYQLAPLRLSLPSLTAIQPVSALVIALLVLQEHISRSALGQATTFMGIVLVAGGSLFASGQMLHDDHSSVAMIDCGADTQQIRPAPVQPLDESITPPPP
jgi:drug/metabolite transporter (DMT)-like permease